MGVRIRVSFSVGVGLGLRCPIWCMPPTRTPRIMVRVKAAGKIYKQVQSFTYLGGAVTEISDMPVEIDRRTRACWMGIRRYLRELFDQP